METRSTSRVGPVPVFPLPNTVFFPETVLPLHVFERRYRTMVRDAVAGEGRIAVTLLKPGWESDYHGCPPIHDVATIGTISDLEPLPDGRFNLRLCGVQRIRLGRTVRNNPYRLVEATAMPERSVDESDPGIVRAKLDLLATHAMLASRLFADQPHAAVVNDSLEFAAAVNRTCSTLPLEPCHRQELLEIDDLVERQSRASCILDAMLHQVLRIQGCATGGDDGGNLN